MVYQICPKLFLGKKFQINFIQPKQNGFFQDLQTVNTKNEKKIIAKFKKSTETFRSLHTFFPHASTLFIRLFYYLNFLFDSFITCLFICFCCLCFFSCKDAGKFEDQSRCVFFFDFFHKDFVNIFVSFVLFFNFYYVLSFGLDVTLKTDVEVTFTRISWNPNLIYYIVCSRLLNTISVSSRNLFCQTNLIWKIAQRKNELVIKPLTKTLNLQKAIKIFNLFYSLMWPRNSHFQL